MPAHAPQGQVLVFDSSTLILFLNDALPEDGAEVLNESVHAGLASISAIVRAEVLAWGGTHGRLVDGCTRTAGRLSSGAGECRHRR
jgi:hypothetical protein